MTLCPKSVGRPIESCTRGAACRCVKRSYDGQCEELARYFYPNGTVHFKEHQRMSNPTGDALTHCTLPPLDADLIDILGRPNFTCGPFAKVLRELLGMKIERKAEHEQAAVIHWTLSLYLEHGSQWAAKGNEILKAAADARARSVK